MRKLSTSDQTDLALLAALFFMLVLFTSYMEGSGPEAERNHFPETSASAESLALGGVHFANINATS